jgi:hypothetical protein
MRCRRELGRLLASSGRTRLLLAALACWYLASTTLVLPRLHRMLPDEIVYLHAAKGVLVHHRFVTCAYVAFGRESCATATEMAGWPVALAIWSSVAGLSSASAMAAATLLGALCVPAAFACGRALLGDEDAALLFSASLCAQPLLLVWATTAENNVPALIFSLAALAAARLHRDLPMPRLLALALACTACASFLRAELALLALPVAALAGPSRPLCRALAIAALLAAAPFSAQVRLMLSHEQNRTYGAGLLAEHTMRFAHEALDGRYGHPVLALAALAGLVPLARSRPREVAALALLCVPLYVLYASTVASQDRFLLVPALLPAAGAGWLLARASGRARSAWAAPLATALVLASLAPALAQARADPVRTYMGFLTYARDEPARRLLDRVLLDAEVRSRLSLCERCYLLSFRPVELGATSSLKALDAAAAMGRQEVLEGVWAAGGTAYYLEQGECLAGQRPDLRPACERLYGGYSLVPIVAFRRGEVADTLLRVGPAP